MGLNIRHSILAAPAGTVGLSAPPPNAGLLPGVTRTAYTGPLTITTNGTIIQNKDLISKPLTVHANNVQIINCHVTGGGFTIDAGGASWSGMVIDHCLIESDAGANSCIATGDNWTVTNCKLTGADNGLMFALGGLAQGNYVYNLGPSGGAGEAHVDGMQTTACSNVRILGNWIESWDTSDVFLKADDGAINTVLVDGNTLIGDPVKGRTSACVYAYSVGTKLCTNVTITNNRLQLSAYGTYFSTQNSTPVITGNVDYNTGAPANSNP